MIPAEAIIRLIKDRQYDQALENLETTEAAHDPFLSLLRGQSLLGLGDFERAMGPLAYSAASGGPEAARAWLKTGWCRQNLGRLTEAIEAYSRALVINPLLPAVRFNICGACIEEGRLLAALPHADWLLENSTDPSRCINAASVYLGLQKMTQALAATERVLLANPGNILARATAIEASQTLCRWDALAEHTRALAETLYQKGLFHESREKHFSHIAWCQNPAWNLGVARAMASRCFSTIAPAYRHDRDHFAKPLRVGYVSADFRDHPVLYLTAGVFEHHDPEELEVFAYCHTPPSGGSIRKRFERALPNLVSIASLSDQEAADRIHADRIDILVDLMGFTRNHRLGIFARRPAPVQVSWLGYPGSTGADFFDYIIADPVVAPDGSDGYFSEHLCRLPETYLSNDQNRPVASPDPDRAEQGLPEEALVYCCFNLNWKLEPVRLRTFMRILADVPGSVLWLAEAAESARDQLRRMAERCGIDPARLVFAPRVPMPAHLSRLSLADLALDTRIYNGHTTTSDALWVGVPVITTRGTNFSSRVSESLLRALNLPELVVEGEEGMYALAVRLARNPAALRAVRKKIEEQRFRAPLFDTVRFTRHLERAYGMMAEKAAQGLPAEPIDVPPLPPREDRFAKDIPRRPREWDGPAPAAAAQGHPDPRRHWVYPGCPLCAHALKDAARQWQECGNCGHVHAVAFWAPGEEPPPRSGPGLPREMPGNIGTNQGSWLSLTGHRDLCAHARELGFTPVLCRNDFLTRNDPGGYGVISLEGTLERVPYPDLYISRSRTLLKPGGALILSCSADRSDPSVIHRFRPERLKRLLEDNGFRVEGQQESWTVAIKP